MEDKGARARRLVEDIFATRDDEIQCVAAQKIMASCVTELLTEAQAQERYPALWTHFRFCSSCAADYQVLMTAARREGETAALPVPGRPPAPPSDWVPGLGYVWRRLAETHQVLVRLLGEAPSGLTFAPAVKGPASGDADEVRRLYLTPDDSGDLDLSVVVRRSQSEAGFYTLTARVQFRSRWQTLAGTRVHLTTADSALDGQTDENGEVVFEGISEEALGMLTIRINA